MAGPHLTTTTAQKVFGRRHWQPEGLVPLKRDSRTILTTLERAPLSLSVFDAPEALSGTGALRIVSEFVKQHLPPACHEVLG